MKTCRAFTLKSSTLVNMIDMDINITSSFQQVPIPVTESIPWRAVWDTGATQTSITQHVVDILKLTPLEPTLNVGTANGIIKSKTYSIDIILPNNIIIPDLVVSCSPLPDGLSVAIGMDIIKQGNFSITNHNGKTTFSFCIPSIGEIDYTKITKARKETE